MFSLYVPYGNTNYMCANFAFRPPSKYIVSHHTPARIFGPHQFLHYFTFYSLFDGFPEFSIRNYSML